MSESIELHVLDQVLRLNCPLDKQNDLREAVKLLEARVDKLRNKTGLLQMDKILSIVALNLVFELEQEKQKSQTQGQVLERISQFDRTLSVVLNPNQTINK